MALTKLTQATQRSYSYKELLAYFYPELITAFILYFIVQFIDSWFVSSLTHTAAYAALGITNSLFHLLTKLAEGMAVGVIVMCGRYNGRQEFNNVGQAAIDAFWTTCAIGAMIGTTVYYGAPYFYQFFGVNQNIITLGVPFIKLRAWSIFFTFIFFSLVGFLRAIKNTHITMYLFLLGSAIFLFFDYALIFGKCGFICMAFQGSALAYVVQYASMSVLALLYIILNPHTRIYGIRLFSTINFRHVWKLMALSVPVMIDKASFALCGLWMAKCVAALCSVGDMQTSLLNSLTTLKHLERFILLPALAYAQIMTFLVSNNYQFTPMSFVIQAIKKVVVLASIFVLCLMVFVIIKPYFLLHWLDVHHSVHDTVLKAIPFLCFIITFDVMQLLFSAILRGAGYMHIVMWTRIFVSAFVFIPVSMLPFVLPISSTFIKFMLVVLALTVSNATMAGIYIVNMWHISKEKLIP